MVFLSIIIVNYKSHQLIHNCLESIYNYIPVELFEVIIVSNDNDEDGKKQIINAFPSIFWIQMEYNAGFARANNAGMRIAKGDVFLLLNPDTLAIDKSIEGCYNKIIAGPYVASGVQLLDDQYNPQISGNYFIKGGLNLLLPIPYWGRFIRWLGYKSKAKVPNVRKAAAIEEVDWISGAFLMVKKIYVRQAGMLDEDFFLYAEEVEWCSRLRKLGSLCIYGDLHIIHLEGQTINKEYNINTKGYYNLFDKKGLQLMVSNHLRIRKQYGSLWFLFILINYTWGFLVYFILSSIKNIFTFTNPLDDWKKCFAFASNVFRIWKLSPAIIRNKPHFYKMI